MLPIWPSTCSRRTVCPECKARVRLEDVRFTAVIANSSLLAPRPPALVARTGVRWASSLLGHNNFPPQSRRSQAPRAALVVSWLLLREPSLQTYRESTREP